MNKERKLLRKQMELLAEQSNGAMDRDLASLSDAMCEVHRELVSDRLAISTTLFSAVCLNLLVCILVHIKKLLRRDR